jgi:hypothetical protein
MNEYMVYKKVCLKFSIMKIRMKISYMAFEKGMTIIELIMRSIMISYKGLVHNGIIKEDPEKVKKQNIIFDDLVNNRVGTLRKFCFWNLTNQLSYNAVASSN